MKTLVKNIYGYLMKNSGFSLLAANLILIAVVFFQYDPFRIFSSGYEGASDLMHAKRESVEKIEFKSGSASVTLSKGKKISSKQEISGSESIFSSSMLQGEGQKRHQWELSYFELGREKKFAADDERLDELFASIADAKRYYSFPRSSEKEKETGLFREKGKPCECIEMLVTYENGKTDILSIGRSIPSGETHAALNDEEKIFLVQTDLNRAAGYGNPEYFRNRKLLQPHITAENISGISVHFLSAPKKKPVILEKAGGIWQMVSPINSPASIGNLAEKIAELKADGFPEKVPSDSGRQDAFRLTVQYKTSMTETASASLHCAGRKDEDVYYFTEGNDVFRVFSGSLDDFFHPEERLTAKESLLN